MATGVPRVNIVRAYKLGQGGGEVPAFFDALRAEIEGMHRSGRGPEALDDLVVRVADVRKKRIYPPLIAGYKKLLETTGARWFAPPRAPVTFGDLEVFAAPALGLTINGAPHMVELHMGNTPCSSKRVCIALTLLSAALAPIMTDAVVTMLDVRRARLRTLRAPLAKMRLLFTGEAAAFCAIHAGL
jgi:hypothetical protein